MIGSEIFKYSLKNLWLRKTRSFLTILSIFIGIMTIFIFISFGLGLYNYVNTLAGEAGADKIFVQARGMSAPGMSGFKLEENDLDTIEKTKGVKEAMGIYLKAFQVEHDNQRKYVYGMGFEPTPTNVRLMLDLATADIIKGRMLKDGDNKKVVLGYNYQIPNKIFEKPLDIGDKLLINGEKFEIIGFFESIGNPQDDSQVYMSYDGFKGLYPDEELTYAVIFARVTDVKQVDAVADRVQKELRKVRNQEEGQEDFYVQTFQDAIEQFSTALNIIIGFIIIIALVSVVVSAVNTANTMVTSVLERTKQIGIMKAIGAKSSTIRKIFLFESSFLGFTAGIIGVILGYLVASFMGGVLKGLGWGFLTPLFTPTLFIGLILFATIVGTLSGVIVAIQASRQEPVNALRYE